MEVRATNILLQCCHPLLMSLSPFIYDNIDSPSVTQLQQEMINEFKALDHRSHTLQLEDSLIQQIKYTMAALIDEVVLNSNWPGKTEWMGKPLQLQLFGNHLAGEGFFIRLNTLRQSVNPNIDLLEVYYVCLQFGFSGKYHILNQDYLQSLKESLYQQIKSLRENMNTRLLIKSASEDYQTSTRYKEIPFWLIGIVTSALIISMYVCTDVIAAKRADHVLQQIKHYRDNVIVV